MKFKKIIIITLLLGILTISAVSANDTNLTDDQITVNDEQAINIDSNESQTNEINNNYKELNELIKTSENNEIELTKDYEYNEKIDSDFYWGISIEKPITINGQGHSINGAGNRLFGIYANNVTIKNLILNNTGINSYRNNFNIINCTFTNPNYDHNTIYLSGAHCNIKNCKFIDCTADYIRTIYCNGKNCTVDTCSIINCSDKTGKAKVYFNSEFKLYNSIFINGIWESATQGEIKNVTIDNKKYDISIFENMKQNQIINITKNYTIISPILLNKNNIKIDGNGNTLTGNKIFIITGNNITLKNCIFANCINTLQIDPNFKKINLNIIDCKFLNCTNSLEDNNADFDGKLYIDSCEFTNGSCVLYSTFKNTTVINSTFLNCGDYLKIAVHFNYEFTLINSSFINGTWFSKKSGEIHNTTIDNDKYDVDIFENIKENQIINITKNYTMITHILINKNNIIIDGNGNTLTGSCIFNITGKNITIRNCKFKTIPAIRKYGNHDYYYDYYTITCGNYCNIVNCTFASTFISKPKNTIIFNNADKEDASAIYSNANNINIANCTFRNYINKVVENIGNNFKIMNCNFIDCNAILCSSEPYNDHPAPTSGCGIYNKGNNFEINNCNFINSSTIDYNDMIDCKGDNNNIIYCSFIDCYVDGNSEYGYFINAEGKNCKVLNCEFKNCEGNTISIKQPQITVNNLNMYYGDVAYYKIKSSQEIPVTIKIDGKKLKTVTTDKNGYAKVKITTKTPKTYKISITCSGKTVTKKLTVKHILSLKTVKVKKSAKKLVLTATLKNKKPIKGKTITFKFKGKKYKGKTNSKGIAKVTIKKSTLKKLKVGKKITYQATYLKDTVKKTAKVKK